MVGEPQKPHPTAVVSPEPHLLSRFLPHQTENTGSRSVNSLCWDDENLTGVEGKIFSGRERPGRAGLKIVGLKMAVGMVAQGLGGVSGEERGLPQRDVPVRGLWGQAQRLPPSPCPLGKVLAGSHTSQQRRPREMGSQWGGHTGLCLGCKRNPGSCFRSLGVCGSQRASGQKLQFTPEQEGMWLPVACLPSLVHLRRGTLTPRFPTQAHGVAPCTHCPLTHRALPGPSTSHLQPPTLGHSPRPRALLPPPWPPRP